MAEFGNDLRQERERQGVSLEAMSRSTKIAQRHLQALECGDLRELPSGVFRRGFLRSYLNALHLDEAAWLPRFEEELRQNGVSEAAPLDLEELARNVMRARGRRDEPETRLRWSGVLAMVMLLLAFGWCVWHFALAGRVRLAEQGTSEPGLHAACVETAPANAVFVRSRVA